ncbi:MAG: Holliday junction resolvase RuvX [Bacilli bacterium]
MRYLGLDLGSRTLGMALSDPTGILATGYKVVRHQEDYNSLIPIIADVVKEKNVSEIVLGLPKNMNNSIGEKGNLSIEFKNKLEQVLLVPVNLEDERLTTVQASNLLIAGDTSRKKRKQVIDGVAATIILQSYLDKKRRNNNG